MSWLGGGLRRTCEGPRNHGGPDPFRERVIFIGWGCALLPNYFGQLLLCEITVNSYDVSTVVPRVVESSPYLTTSASTSHVSRGSVTVWRHRDAAGYETSAGVIDGSARTGVTLTTFAQSPHHVVHQAVVSTAQPFPLGNVYHSTRALSVT